MIVYLIQIAVHGFVDGDLILVIIVTFLADIFQNGILLRIAVDIDLKISSKNRSKANSTHNTRDVTFINVVAGYLKIRLVN